MPKQTHEVEFFDLDLEKVSDQDRVKGLYALGWRLIWPEKMLTNDGHRDFCRHLVIMERELDAPIDVSLGAVPAAEG